MTSTKERTDLEILSHNLLWLRKKYGYSQKTMANILKIDVASLRSLERGAGSAQVDCGHPVRNPDPFSDCAVCYSVEMDGIKTPRISSEIRGIISHFSSGGSH